jgi:type I restriction enzyme R subunit
MLRETLLDEDDIDLGNVVLSHYRVAKIRQQDLVLKKTARTTSWCPAKAWARLPQDKKEEFLSQIIHRLNEVFVTDQLTDKDMVNYAYTIRDKVGENIKVMKQIENNSPEQAMLGDFSKAIDDAIMDSSEAHQNQMMQLLADPSKAANFARIVFDLLVQVIPPISTVTRSRAVTRQVQSLIWGSAAQGYAGAVVMCFHLDLARPLHGNDIGHAAISHTLQ